MSSHEGSDQFLALPHAVPSVEFLIDKLLYEPEVTSMTDLIRQEMRVREELVVSGILDGVSEERKAIFSFLAFKYAQDISNDIKQVRQII